jgi:hypothetical protein
MCIGGILEFKRTAANGIEKLVLVFDMGSVGGGILNRSWVEVACQSLANGSREGNP